MALKFEYDKETRTAIVCGVEDESYIAERLAEGKPVVRLSERIYKDGQWKAISPRGLKKKYHDHTKYRKSPVYLLCCGGYVASDFHIVRAYPGKMFKWGYFPEKKLYDLHFYVFDVNGKLTGYKKVMPIDDNDVIEEAAQTEKVSIRAKSGESYIYAVANINRSTTYYLDKTDLDLLNINEGNSDEEYRINIEESTLTRNKLLSINFKRVYGDENNLFAPNPSGSVFVMSGYVNDGQTVIIPKGTNVSLPQDKNIIKLYRILAKNTFTITSGTSKGKFTPKYYSVCNVPTGGVLIPKLGISSTVSYLT